MPTAALSPRARRDLLAATRWIARDHPAAARAFRDAVARAAEHIGEHRDIGVTRLDFADATHRFVVLTGFPYVIVYNNARSPPLIVRVLHAARDLQSALREP
jgi:toxin ParE1/3/4